MPSLQLRVDETLGARIKSEAARHNVSANKWLIDAINQRLETEEALAWREGFEAMGRDPDCNDVEYAIYAQAEVVFGDH